MFKIVKYNGEKFGILDTSDNVIEWYTPAQVKAILQKGVKIWGTYLSEPNLYNFDGLNVNIAERNVIKVGKWIIIVRVKGDRYGSKLESLVSHTTLFIYDSSVNWDKTQYPYGQYITAFYAYTFMRHHGKLILNMEVKQWSLSADEVLYLQKKLKEGRFEC